MGDLLRKTGAQFISIFSEHEDDPDQEIQALYSLNAKLIKDINSERGAAKQREKAMQTQHAQDLQQLSEELAVAKVEQERVKDSLTFLREEATLLEDQIKRAEQLRTELARTLQSPENPPQLPDDESLEFYRSEVMTSRQVQANLKAVVRADELLLEEAARARETAIEQLQAKETEVEKALAERAARTALWTEEVRQLQAEIDTHKSARQEADEKDLEELLQSQKRTLETLKNEKTALLLQLESRRAQVPRSVQRVSSRISDIDFIQPYPALLRVAEFVDDRLLDLRMAMDDLAVVKLAVVVYLLLLHLWVLLSTLGVGGC